MNTNQTIAEVHGKIQPPPPMKRVFQIMGEDIVLLPESDEFLDSIRRINDFELGSVAEDFDSWANAAETSLIAISVFLEMAERYSTAANAESQIRAVISIDLPRSEQLSLLEKADDLKYYMRDCTRTLELMTNVINDMKKELS